MTPEEFNTAILQYNDRIAEHQNEIFRLRNEKEKFKAKYIRDAFKESGYVHGQKVIDKQGKIWFVSGAYESRGSVNLLFNKAKKDGTMSKLSGLGHGQPYVKIK